MATVSDLIVASAQVREGRLFIRNRRAFDRSIALMNDRWELEITIARLRATRSAQANRYYWGVVIEWISRHTGYHPDEAHDLMKMLHLPKALAVCDGNGEVKGNYVMGGSTRSLNTTEFYEYVERIRQWAAETLDLNIPSPDEGNL